MDISNQQDDVASPLPIQPPIKAEETPSNLISTAVQEGVSAALERLGIRESVLPSELDAEAPVTRADITAKWSYPHNPKGARTKLKPWTEDAIDKRTGQAIVIMKVPRGLFTERIRPQGRDRKECIKNGRDLMLAALDRQEGLDDMSVEDRRKFIGEVKTLTKAGFSAEIIWEVIADGKRVQFARNDYKIPKRIDVVGLGIHYAILSLLTVRQVVEQFTSTFKELINPTRKGQKSRSNARAVCNHLAAFIEEETKKANEDSSFFRVMEKTTLIEKYFNRFIHGEHGSDETRVKNWEGLRDLFDFSDTKLHLPRLSYKVLGARPKVGPKIITSPKADILERFFNLIKEEDPRYLPMGVFNLWIGRPEENYDVLANLPFYLREGWVHYPLDISKGGSVDSKNIRICPAALFWLAEDPRWLDPTATDFRPLHKNGKALSYKTVEMRLNKFLLKAGWTGKVKEPLRHSKISAQWALEVPEALIVQEAGHADNIMIHARYIDKSWSMANGRAVYTLFPRGTQNPPTKNLHQAYRQELEKTDEILPAYVIRPSI